MLGRRNITINFIRIPFAIRIQDCRGLISIRFCGRMNTNQCAVMSGLGILLDLMIISTKKILEKIRN